MRLSLGFLTLTFLLSWGSWLAAAAIPASQTAVRSTLFLLGTFAPGIIALLLAPPGRGWREGEGAWRLSGAVELLRRVVRWDVGGRWYLFAAGYMATIKLLVALITRVGTGAWPAFGETNVAIMAAAIVFSTWAQAGEEIGWRGFLLPRLADGVGLVPASLLLGAIWAVWHLPLFFIQAGDTYGQSFPLYALQLIAISVALAWLYWRTGGSLLLVMILHSAINNTKDIVPSVVPGATNPFALSPSRTTWLTVGLLWFSAALFAWQMRRVAGVPGSPSGASTLTA
jgi:uncharacterized protein